MAQNYPAPAPTADAPIGAILSDLVEQSQTLVHQQVALVRAEATETVKAQVQSKAKGVGLLAGAGVFALIGLALLGVTLILVLRFWLELWLAALIVTLLYFVIGGLLAFLGRRALTPKKEAAAVAS